MDNIFTKQYEVTYRDTDARGECFLTSYMNFMADCGLTQDETYGFVISDMVKENHAWMLVDYEINIYEYVKYKGKLKSITYVEGMNKFYAKRCFKIYDEDNKLILDGKTLVILVDSEKKRPISIPDEHYKAYGVTERNPSIGRQKLKLSKCKKIDSEKKFNVRYSDIDFNSHVGNVTYLGWILETIPFDIMKNYKINSVKIKYQKELTYGEQIKVKTEIVNKDNDISAYHEIVNENDEVVALLETHWTQI
ncbi:acyl-[acyl-carrier-protein] thioesterase [Terrisporobacter sp.]